MTCAICGTALGEAAASQTEPANQRNSRAQEARELLNRWANGRSADPFGPPRKRIFDDALQSPSTTHQEEAAARTSAPTTPAPAISNAAASAFETTRPSNDAQRPAHDAVTHAEPEARPAAEPRANDSTINAELDRLTNEILARVEKISRDGSARAASLDDAHQAPVARPDLSATQPTASEPTASNSPTSGADTPAAIARRIDAPVLSVPEPNHPTVAAMPHQQPSSASTSSRPQPWVAASRKSGGLMSQVGPGLSYVGILGITLGLSLVILGTYGASTNLAPTGWLIATLGQMLLLLGVVTSVSVGMEQTAADMRANVDERMRVISEQLDRLTQTRQRVDAAHSAEAPAPHFATMPQRTTATQSIES